jgi:ribonuclease D
LCGGVEKKMGGASRWRYWWRGLEREVWVTSDESWLDNVLERWRSHLECVAFDIEYCSSSQEPALISIALTPTIALLWHRVRAHNKCALPKMLTKLILNEKIPKVGFAIDNDMAHLARHSDLLHHGWPKGVFDLQTLYRFYHRKNKSKNSKDTIGMVEAVNAVNDKSNQFTKIKHDGNWAKSTLSQDQIIYAAGDVFVTFEVIDAL